MPGLGATLRARMKSAGVIAQFVLPALVAVGIMTAGERIVGTDPVKSSIEPTAFVWADRVFSSKPAFDSWLRSRGSTYVQWATRHPAAAATVERRNVAQLPQDAVAVSPVTGPNMLLLTLGVGGFVALALALAVALRYLRLTVLRPLPTLAFGHSAPIVSAARELVVGRAKSRPRSRSGFSAAEAVQNRVAMWARATNAGVPLRRGIRIRYWLFRMQYAHPELVWYAVALTFAAAVGLLVPLLSR
jgi:hypothetical protein